MLFGFAPEDHVIKLLFQSLESLSFLLVLVLNEVYLFAKVFLALFIVGDILRQLSYMLQHRLFLDLLEFFLLVLNVFLCLNE